MFTVAFGVIVSNLFQARALASVLTAANMRTICTKQAIIDLRKLSALIAENEYAADSYFYTMNSFDCVGWHTQLLAYGTTTNATFPYIGKTPYVPYVATVESGMPSSLSAATTAAVHKAMLEDACPLIAASAANASGFDMAACRAYGSGVLGQGLVAAISLWYQTAYILADRNLRQGFWYGNDPSTNNSWVSEGVGYIVPPSSFDYSTVVCQPPCLLESFDLPSCAGCTLPPTVVPALNCGGSNASACARYDPPPAPLPVPGATYISNAVLLNSDEMQLLIDGEAHYLTPAFLAIASMYAADAQTSLALNGLTLVIFIPLYLVFFVGYILFVFHPLVQRLNTEIQTKRASFQGAPRARAAARTRASSHPRSHPQPPRTRTRTGGMLLYLPLEIVAGVKSLRALIEAISGLDRRRVAGGATAAAASAKAAAAAATSSSDGAKRM
jgi:hypothetical protein